LASGYEG